MFIFPTSKDLISLPSPKSGRKNLSVRARAPLAGGALSETDQASPSLQKQPPIGDPETSACTPWRQMAVSCVPVATWKILRPLSLLPEMPVISPSSMVLPMWQTVMKGSKSLPTAPTKPATPRHNWKSGPMI